MMTHDEIEGVYLECQALARYLAPNQNHPVTKVVPDDRGFVRRVRDFFLGTPVQTAPTIEAQKVTRVVNALLNAGNLLEYLRKEGKL